MTASRPLLEKTIERREPKAADELPGVNPLLARIYSSRAVQKPAEIDLSLRNLLRPDDLMGLAEAVDLLAGAVQADARMLIVGDFDADGATATALGVMALKSMGANEVVYFVPNRFGFGYGLTPEVVDVAAQFEPELIITVDNGISSIDGVQHAAEMGMSVLITDHHLPGDELPMADAIVNPNMRGDKFQSKNLAGVGVMFYVLSALRAELKSQGWFSETGIEEPRLAEYLDLVALGTVADVVPLDRNNRILVQQGLGRINEKGKLPCRPGIKALLEVGKREIGKVTATDLGFAVGPRLNAAGRLEDMQVGIECLMTDDLDRARELAQQLDDINKQRQEIERDMQADATAAVEEIEAKSDEGIPRGICLFNENWHHGIVGLVAARIRERFDRPTIALAPAGDDEIKGSGRSVPGLHIRDLLDTVSRDNPDLIIKFGGHAMAAGLSLKPENVDAFKIAYEKAVVDALGDKYKPGTVMTDGELPGNYLRVEVADALRDAGPWGQGFPEPLFDGTFELVEHRQVGTDHVKMRLKDSDSGQVHDAIAFRFGDRLDALSEVSQLAVVYRLEVNDFRGERKPQLVVTHMHPC